MIAEWGVQVTHAFATIVDEVPASETAHFLRPVVRIDLGRAARLCFFPWFQVNRTCHQTRRGVAEL